MMAIGVMGGTGVMATTDVPKTAGMIVEAKVGSEKPVVTIMLRRGWDDGKDCSNGNIGCHWYHCCVPTGK